MKNHPANDPYPKTLSYSPFVSGTDDFSVLKKAVLRLFPKSSRRIIPSPRTADREAAAASSIFKWNAVSRYDVGVYGQPRILSKWEVILHALAWPAIAGVVIGFGVVIAPLVIHNSAAPKPQESAGQPQVAAWQEEAP